MARQTWLTANGWAFDLVLHGARVQLVGRRNGETISRWLNPTDSISDAAVMLMAAPTCCLV
ncbi:MAG: hypothetical protein RLZZ219_1871 [Cyanobacteriota bacterium]